MQIDWISALVGFGAGVPSGFLGNYLWKRYDRWRKRKEGEYYTSTYSRNTFTFEGQIMLKDEAEVKDINDMIYSVVLRKHTGT